MFSNYIKYGIRYSLRYILKYIIRVIIFFGIIYLISFLSGKHLFISDVNAKSINVNPDKICAIEGTDGQCIYITPLTYQVSERHMYGNTFGSDKTRSRIIWHFNGNNIKDKTYDIDFILYIQGLTPDLYPNRGYISNSSDNIYSCDIDKSRWAGATGVASVEGSVMVRCNNVNLTDNNFTFYLFDLATRTSGVMAVSHATLTDNVSVKQAQEIEKTNDTIKDDNVDSSTNKGSSFFNNFDSGDEGSLTDIVSLPLDFVQHLNDTCQPFTIPTGKLGDITIPCLSSLWSSTSFAGIINTASLIINGIICYKLLSSLFLFFKELKDPDDDKVEVMNL